MTLTSMQVQTPETLNLPNSSKNDNAKEFFSDLGKDLKPVETEFHSLCELQKVDPSHISVKLFDPLPKDTIGGVEKKMLSEDYYGLVSTQSFKRFDVVDVFRPALVVTNPTGCSAKILHLASCIGIVKSNPSLEWKEFILSLYPRTLSGPIDICAKTSRNTFVTESGKKHLIYDRLSFANHSCLPNCVQMSMKDDTTYLVAVHPIKKGDEITISYNRYITQEKPTFHFTCACSWCSSSKPNALTDGDWIEMNWRYTCTACNKIAVSPPHCFTPDVEKQILRQKSDTSEDISDNNAKLIHFCLLMAEKAMQDSMNT